MKHSKEMCSDYYCSWHGTLVRKVNVANRENEFTWHALHLPKVKWLNVSPRHPDTLLRPWDSSLHADPDTSTLPCLCTRTAPRQHSPVLRPCRAAYHFKAKVVSVNAGWMQAASDVENVVRDACDHNPTFPSTHTHAHTHLSTFTSYSDQVQVSIRKIILTDCHTRQRWPLWL